MTNKIAPAALREINTAALVVAMTSGLAGAEFLGLAELIVGPSEWFEPGPRPCVPGWRSIMSESYEIEFGHMAQSMVVHHIMDMVKDQHREAAELIKEVRKYIRPLDKRQYPRPADEQIKFWTDENGRFRHNVAILNKNAELTMKVAPIVKRLGFSEVLTFHENAKTRANFQYITSRLDTMNSIIAMDSFGGPAPEPKDAIPRIQDKSMASLIAREFKRRR